MDDRGNWRLNLTPSMKNILHGQEAFENDLARFCAPIGWLPSISAPTTLLEGKSATCALVDTGRIKVFVTCEHVWSDWTSYKNENPDAELLVGLDDGVPHILTNAELLSSKRDCDLAVVKAEVNPQQMRTKAFYRIEGWPIPQPKVGDIVAIIGFPGTGRILSGDHAAGWSINSLGYRVSGVTPESITLAPEKKDRMSYDENGNEIPHGKIGGMSGSPAFLLTKEGSPLLVGFLYEGNTSDNFIFLTHAHHLQPDGTLHR